MSGPLNRTGVCFCWTPSIRPTSIIDSDDCFNIKIPPGPKNTFFWLWPRLRDFARHTVCC